MEIKILTIRNMRSALMGLFLVVGLSVFGQVPKNEDFLGCKFGFTKSEVVGTLEKGGYEVDLWEDKVVASKLNFYGFKGVTLFYEFNADGKFCKAHYSFLPFLYVEVADGVYLPLMEELTKQYGSPYYHEDKNVEKMELNYRFSGFDVVCFVNVKIFRDKTYLMQLDYCSVKYSQEDYSLKQKNN